MRTKSFIDMRLRCTCDPSTCTPACMVGSALGGAALMEATSNSRRGVLACPHRPPAIRHRDRTVRMTFMVAYTQTRRKRSVKMGGMFRTALSVLLAAAAYAQPAPPAKKAPATEVAGIYVNYDER